MIFRLFPWTSLISFIDPVQSLSCVPLFATPWAGVGSLSFLQGISPTQSGGVAAGQCWGGHEKISHIQGQREALIKITAATAAKLLQSCPTLFMGFPRQEYWSGLLFPSLGVLPDPEIKPVSPALQVDSLPTEPPGKPFNNS